MTDPSYEWLAQELLDETDAAILDQVRTVHGRADPPPADLDARVRFAIELESLDVEAARRVGDALVGSGARASERTRTITFDSASLTIMVSVVERPDGLVRLDGWLAPAGSHRVELRLDTPGAGQTVTSDDTGRFVFDGVPHGLAQLHVRLANAGAGSAATVVTPSLLL